MALSNRMAEGHLQASGSCMAGQTDVYVRIFVGADDAFGLSHTTEFVERGERVR